MPTTNNIFSYSSNPLPVKPSASRKKYKDDGGNNLTMMSDPRVIRGMVSSSLKKSSGDQLKDTSAPGGRGKGNSNATGTSSSDEKNEKRQLSESGHSNLHPPGNGHGMYSYHVSSIIQENINISQYLIEKDSITNKKITKINETQTDEFHHRPVTPEYIPKKTGIDNSTQVEDVNDLFDFNSEIEPIINLITSKVIEQSLMEIQNETELKFLSEKIEYFGQQKLMNQQWIKKREEESIADSCIKDLALKGMKEKVMMENNVKEKVAARQMMIQVIPELISESMRELYEEEVWKEPSKEYILKDLLPEMRGVMRSHAELYNQVTEILDGMSSTSLTLNLNSLG